jgi:hypothetical protein
MPKPMPTAIGRMHKTPKDVRDIIEGSAKLRERWDALTPLARNEWICWVTIVKKQETRKDHLKRLRAEILQGKRRPCCWPGCPHRRPNARKWFQARRAIASQNQHGAADES